MHTPHWDGIRAGLTIAYDCERYALTGHILFLMSMNPSHRPALGSSNNTPSPKYPKYEDELCSVTVIKLYCTSWRVPARRSEVLLQDWCRLCKFGDLLPTLDYQLGCGLQKSLDVVCDALRTIDVHCWSRPPMSWQGNYPAWEWV